MTEGCAGVRFVHLHAALFGQVFCIHPVFLVVRLEHKQTQKSPIHIMLQLFPNLSVMLE